LKSATYDEVFDAFISRVLTSTTSLDIPSARLPIIVIDALDECGGNEDRDSYLPKVLETIRRWPDLPSHFKLFVTSRMDGKIARALGAGSPRCKVLEVGAKVTKESTVDIRLYLQRRLSSIALDFPSLPKPWPSARQLDELTAAAAGLFIWASTLVRLVSHSQPATELKEILAMIKTHRLTGKLLGLGELYAAILASKFPQQNDKELFKKLSAVVITSRVPLTVEKISILIPQLGRTDMDYVCGRLTTVLDDTGSLHFLHQSFVDFLITPPPHSVCPDGFRYDKTQWETVFSERCFRIMERGLHFNMGNFSSSYIENENVPGLREHISWPMSYGCRFWGSHTARTICDTEAIQTVTSFLHKFVLYWLEVLSIEGIIEVASYSIGYVNEWRASASPSEEVGLHHSQQ
jgi:hypothetical protein